MAAYHVTSRNRYRQPPLVPDEIAIQSLVLGRNPFILRRMEEDFSLLSFPKRPDYGPASAASPLSGVPQLRLSYGQPRLSCVPAPPRRLSSGLSSCPKRKAAVAVVPPLFQVFLLLPQADYVLLLFVMLLLQQSLLLLTFGNQAVFLRFHPQ